MIAEYYARNKIGRKVSYEGTLDECKLWAISSLLFADIGGVLLLSQNREIQIDGKVIWGFVEIMRIN